MSGPPDGDHPSQWRVRARQVIVGAILIGLGMSIGASIRQSLPRSSTPSPSPSPVRSAPPSTGSGIRGLGSGALFLLSGSVQGLPGGPDGEILWRVDLSSGRVRMGPAVALGSWGGQFGGGIYPNYTGNAPPPAALATTPRRVVVYEQNTQQAFLAAAPIGGSAFGSVPLQPQAAISDYSVGAAGRIAFANTTSASEGPLVQQVGVLGRQLAFQGRAPRVLLTDAYAVGGGLYATGVQGRNPGGPGSRPVVVRVARGRLRVVLAGWEVLGEEPDGTGLLVERLPRFGSRAGVSHRLMLWRPGSRPRPRASRDLAVGGVLAGFHGGVDGLLVTGRFHGSPGLFLTLTRGTKVPLRLPPGVHPSDIVSATFTGSETYFLVDGLGQAYVCQLSVEGCRPLKIPEMPSELPILAVASAG